jgi:hypothetical protein
MNNNQSINNNNINVIKNYDNNNNLIEVRINLPIEKNTESSIKIKLKKIINYFL